MVYAAAAVGRSKTAFPSRIWRRAPTNRGRGSGKRGGRSRCFAASTAARSVTLAAVHAPAQVWPQQQHEQQRHEWRARVVPAASASNSRALSFPAASSSTEAIPPSAENQLEAVTKATAVAPAAPVFRNSSATLGLLQMEHLPLQRQQVQHLQDEPPSQLRIPSAVDSSGPDDPPCDAADSPAPVPSSVAPSSLAAPAAGEDMQEKIAAAGTGAESLVNPTSHRSTAGACSSDTPVLNEPASPPVLIFLDFDASTVDVAVHNDSQREQQPVQGERLLQKTELHHQQQESRHLPLQQQLPLRPTESQHEQQHLPRENVRCMPVSPDDSHAVTLSEQYTCSGTVLSNGYRGCITGNHSSSRSTCNHNTSMTCTGTDDGSNCGRLSAERKERPPPVRVPVLLPRRREVFSTFCPSFSCTAAAQSTCSNDAGAGATAWAAASSPGKAPHYKSDTLRCSPSCSSAGASTLAKNCCSSFAAGIPVNAATAALNRCCSPLDVATAHRASVPSAPAVAFSAGSDLPLSSPAAATAFRSCVAAASDATPLSPSIVDACQLRCSSASSSVAVPILEQHLQHEKDFLVGPQQLKLGHEPERQPPEPQQAPTLWHQQPRTVQQHQGLLQQQRVVHSEEEDVLHLQQNQAITESQCLLGHQPLQHQQNEQHKAQRGGQHRQLTIQQQHWNQLQHLTSPHVMNQQTVVQQQHAGDGEQDTHLWDGESTFVKPLSFLCGASQVCKVTVEQHQRILTCGAPSLPCRRCCCDTECCLPSRCTCLSSARECSRRDECGASNSQSWTRGGDDSNNTWHLYVPERGAAGHQIVSNRWPLAPEGNGSHTTQLAVAPVTAIREDTDASVYWSAEKMPAEELQTEDRCCSVTHGPDSGSGRSRSGRSSCMRNAAVSETGEFQQQSCDTPSFAPCSGAQQEHTQGQHTPDQSHHGQQRPEQQQVPQDSKVRLLLPADFLGNDLRQHNISEFSMSSTGTASSGTAALALDCATAGVQVGEENLLQNCCSHIHSASGVAAAAPVAAFAVTAAVATPSSYTAAACVSTAADSAPSPALAPPAAVDSTSHAAAAPLLSVPYATSSAAAIDAFASTTSRIVCDASTCRPPPVLTPATAGTSSLMAETAPYRAATRFLATAAHTDTSDSYVAMAAALTPYLSATTAAVPMGAHPAVAAAAGEKSSAAVETAATREVKHQLMYCDTKRQNIGVASGFEKHLAAPPAAACLPAYSTSFAANTPVTAGAIATAPNSPAQAVAPRAGGGVVATDTATARGALHKAALPLQLHGTVGNEGATVAAGVRSALYWDTATAYSACTAVCGKLAPAERVATAGGDEAAQAAPVCPAEKGAATANVATLAAAAFTAADTTAALGEGNIAVLQQNVSTAALTGNSAVPVQEPTGHFWMPQQELQHLQLQRCQVHQQEIPQRQQQDRLQQQLQRIEKQEEHDQQQQPLVNSVRRLPDVTVGDITAGGSPYRAQRRHQYVSSSYSAVAPLYNSTAMLLPASAVSASHTEALALQPAAVEQCGPIVKHQWTSSLQQQQQQCRQTQQEAPQVPSPLTPEGRDQPPQAPVYPLTAPPSDAASYEIRHYDNKQLPVYFPQQQQGSQQQYLYQQQQQKDVTAAVEKYWPPACMQENSLHDASRTAQLPQGPLQQQQYDWQRHLAYTQQQQSEQECVDVEQMSCVPQQEQLSAGLQPQMFHGALVPPNSTGTTIDRADDQLQEGPQLQQPKLGHTGGRRQREKHQLPKQLDPQQHKLGQTEGRRQREKHQVAEQLEPQQPDGEFPHDESQHQQQCGVENQSQHLLIAVKSAPGNCNNAQVFQTCEVSSRCKSHYCCVNAAQPRDTPAAAATIAFSGNVGGSAPFCSLRAAAAAAEQIAGPAAASTAVGPQQAAALRAPTGDCQLAGAETLYVAMAASVRAAPAAISLAQSKRTATAEEHAFVYADEVLPVGPEVDKPQQRVSAAQQYNSLESAGTDKDEEWSCSEGVEMREKVHQKERQPVSAAATHATLSFIERIILLRQQLPHLLLVLKNAEPLFYED